MYDFVLSFLQNVTESWAIIWFFLDFPKSKCDGKCKPTLQRKKNLTTTHNLHNYIGFDKSPNKGPV